MPVTTIVRIPRKDPDNSVDFVLVHVEQESLNSSRLTLDATEGEYAYTAISGFKFEKSLVQDDSRSNTDQQQSHPRRPK